MVRLEKGHPWFIADEIMDRVKEKIKRQSRKDSLTAYVQWIVDMYAKDQLEEVHVMRARIEAELRPQLEEKIRMDLEKKIVNAAGAEKLRKKGDEQQAAS